MLNTNVVMFSPGVYFCVEYLHIKVQYIIRIAEYIKVLIIDPALQRGFKIKLVHMVYHCMFTVCKLSHSPICTVAVHIGIVYTTVQFYNQAHGVEASNLLESQPA